MIRVAALGGGVTGLVAAAASSAVSPFLGFAAAFVLYLAALVLLRRSPASLALVCAGAAAIQLVLLVGPLLLSNDVYTYYAYGRIAEDHGQNPYVAPPARFPHDAALASVSPAWRDTTSVYGPAFTAASEGVAEIAGGSAGTAASLYRGLAAAGMLALVVLSAGLSPRPSFAAAAVGWNPLFAIHFAGGGHNDVWMMVPALGAVVLASRSRPRSAGACWALAGSFKWIALALLPFQLLASRPVVRRDIAAGFTAAAAVAVATSVLLYGTAWLEALLPFAHRHSRSSIPSRLVEAGVSRPLATAVSLVLALGGLAWLAWHARGRRPRLGLASALIVLGSPWVLPWYAIWTVPLAVAEDDTFAVWVTIGLTGYLLGYRLSTPRL